MSRLLRADLDELDAYVTRVAEATGIPASHVEKDYWVTEVLRGGLQALARGRTTDSRPSEWRIRRKSGLGNRGFSRWPS